MIQNNDKYTIDWKIIVKLIMNKLYFTKIEIIYDSTQYINIYIYIIRKIGQRKYTRLTKEFTYSRLCVGHNFYQIPMCSKSMMSKSKALAVVEIAVCQHLKE